MSKKPETLFKEKVLEDLKKLPYCWAEKIQQVTIRGTPDILLCANGKFVALELKKDSKAKLDELQKYKLTKIQQAGGWSYSVTPQEWPEALEAISLLCQQR